MKTWLVTRRSDAEQKLVDAATAFEAVEKSGLGAFSECETTLELGPQEFIPHEDERDTTPPSFPLAAHLASINEELTLIEAKGPRELALELVRMQRMLALLEEQNDCLREENKAYEVEAAEQISFIKKLLANIGKNSERAAGHESTEEAV